MPNAIEHAVNGWVKGVPIVLFDGQEFHFPVPLRSWAFPSEVGRPWREVEATRDDNRHFTRAFWDRQAEVIAYLEAAEARNMEGWDDVAYLRLAFPLAADLLRRNYDFTPDQIRDVMPYAPGDDDNVRMWRQITAVLRHVPRDMNAPPAQPEPPAAA